MRSQRKMYKKIVLKNAIKHKKRKHYLKCFKTSRTPYTYFLEKNIQYSPHEFSATFQYRGWEGGKDIKSIFVKKFYKNVLSEGGLDCVITTNEGSQCQQSQLQAQVNNKSFFEKKERISFTQNQKHIQGFWREELFIIFFF